MHIEQFFPNPNECFWNLKKECPKSLSQNKFFTSTFAIWDHYRKVLVPTISPLSMLTRQNWFKPVCFWNLSNPIQLLDIIKKGSILPKQKIDHIIGHSNI